MSRRRFVAALSLTLLLPAFAILPSCTDPSCADGGEGCPCEKAVECGELPPCKGWRCDGTCHMKDAPVAWTCAGGVCDGAGHCLGCLQDADCGPGHTCEARNICSSCDDGVKNGDETDVDCGGSCPLCPGTCNVDTDCPAGYCWEGLCVRCDDGIQNGDETGIDCGNSGGRCPICSGPFCETNAECASGACEAGVCCAKPCPICYDCGFPFGECVPRAYGTYDTKNAPDPSIVCVGIYVCDGKGRCALDYGEPCTTNEDCASGNCLSGTCDVM
ncbi:hypothetical protein [Polyangium sp. 15x6]|uniref:hypothetical protein n=1 Tax=Polyangium sp. 15x6 TaxID=3042687 RepID=UPI00249A825C|nr:hypothetical protein [Polyangium sp. 15x6]MDI3284712.1 hypothetical protein [Polyangium sp. 15x6]